MRWRYPALAGAAATLLAGGYLWYALLSPFGYTPPATLPPAGAGPHPVFVYGTLRYRAVRRLVIGRTGTPASAVLPGYRRDGLDIEAAPGGQVRGLVLEVSGDELARLDRYERLGMRYDRVRVTLADGTGAWVYRRLGDDER